MERHEYIPGIMYLKTVIVLVVMCFVGRKYSEAWVNVLKRPIRLNIAFVYLSLYCGRMQM